MWKSIKLNSEGGESFGRKKQNDTILLEKNRGFRKIELNSKISCPRSQRTEWSLWSRGIKAKIKSYWSLIIIRENPQKFLWTRTKDANYKKIKN